MAFALTVLFLGREFPKPTVWVSPSRVVALGGSITIRCEGLYPDMEFFLRKAGHLNLQAQSVPDGTVAEFPIPSVSREDGGSYTCDYRAITDQNRWSYPSDPVRIIVGEPSCPKPNIALRPSGGVSLGGAVTVWCRGQRWGVRFVLNKEGRHFPSVDLDGFGAVFPISNVSREHSGSYSCSYHSRSEPFAVSYPSDPVELVVREGSLPKPSISVSPGGVIPVGGNVIIRCRHQRLGLRFLLYKDGDGNHLTYTDPAGSEAEFLITSARREQSGNYTCRYSNRTGPAAYSEPSAPVQIIVAGGSESPATPVLTNPIIAGVSAAAAGFLLPVAFVCFRITRARKGAAQRPSSPLGVLKAPDQQDPVYSSIDEGKQPPTLEPDPGAEGLTYAELDHQVLQAKQGAPAPAPEPILYTAINYLTTLDLTKGYWQVPLDPEARAKSAFTTPVGLFEFLVLPFGLKGAPATFQRLVDQLLRGMEDFALAYIEGAHGEKQAC
ncbi:killer cell immunoglobulin-like receptor 3DL1 [Emys orbicularis]|uniref:killer cell immunoglobulin-like receptor 3DL1 n=1 Tax=Emys orbicularis TaxID=82168 RepID=UPI0031FD36A4